MNQPIMIDILRAIFTKFNQIMMHMVKRANLV
jgi:hypothetical protein